MYLDVDVLYALVKEKDFHKEYAERITATAGAKVTSCVSLLELEIVVKRELGDEKSMEIDRWVRRLVPGIDIAEFTEKQFAKSLELRKKYGLGIFDAVHAAVCLEKGGQMASTDHAFDRVPGIARIK
ncbi:MAG: PIN domain-containing protein [Candidatus Micrarchaeota archaeon]